jgi:hypothetical protein
MSRAGCPTCGRWVGERDGKIVAHHHPDGDYDCAASGQVADKISKVKPTSNPSKWMKWFLEVFGGNVQKERRFHAHRRF